MRRIAPELRQNPLDGIHHPPGLVDRAESPGGLDRKEEPPAARNRVVPVRKAYPGLPAGPGEDPEGRSDVEWIGRSGRDSPPRRCASAARIPAGYRGGPGHGSTSDRASALATAIGEPARGILFGGLATAAAFLSLVVMSYPVMVQLGWITAFGLAAILGCSFTVLPLALSFTAPPRRPAAWLRWADLAHRLGQGRPRWWLVAWIALVTGSLWAARRIPYEPHPWKIALRGNPATADLERVRRLLGPSFTPLLMISTGPTPEDALARDREATRALDRIRHRAGIAAIESLSRWLPDSVQQRASIEFVGARTELFSPERFRRDFEAGLSRLKHADPSLESEYLPLVARFLNPKPEPLSLGDFRRFGLDSLLDRHLVRRGDGYLAVSYIYLRDLPWAAGVMTRYTAAVERDGGPTLAAARFGGEAFRGAFHAGVLRRDVAVSTALALVLVGSLLLFEFRRPALVGLCLLPLACGIAAAFGVMALAGIELNALTLSIAPLLIGTAVDDGIHVVEGLGRGETPLQVLRQVGPPMTITTLSEAAGFACLGFARFGGVGEVGVVGATGLLVALAASLQLVPMCHTVFRLRGR